MNEWCAKQDSNTPPPPQEKKEKRKKEIELNPAIRY